MSAYTEAIQCARGLLDGHRVHQNRDEYKRALIELCASLDPAGPMDDAIDKARALIDYNPERRVEFAIIVPDRNVTDVDISVMIEATLRNVTKFEVVGPPEVSS